MSSSPLDPMSDATKPRYQPMAYRGTGPIYIYDNQDKKWLHTPDLPHSDTTSYANALNILEHSGFYWQKEAEHFASIYWRHINEISDLRRLADMMYNSGRKAGLDHDFYEPFNAYYEKYLKNNNDGQSK